MRQRPLVAGVNTYSVEVLDAVACLLVLAEAGLVLLGVKLGLGGKVDLLVALEDVDSVNLVRNNVQLGSGGLDVVGDLGSVNHCGKRVVCGGVM